jgi:hypothetical protein
MKGKNERVLSFNVELKQECVQSVRMNKREIRSRKNELEVVVAVGVQGAVLRT